PVANGMEVSFAHRRTFESGRSVAILLTRRQKSAHGRVNRILIFSTISINRPLAKYTGQWARKIVTGRCGSIAPSNDLSQRLAPCGRFWTDRRRSIARRSDTGYRI